MALSKDRLAMNSETVKPIPPRAAIPAIIFQSAPFGAGVMPSLTVPHENSHMPKNFPRTSERIMVSDKPSNAAVGDIPWKDIPALANANSGTMK